MLRELSPESGWNSRGWSLPEVSCGAPGAPRLGGGWSGVGQAFSSTAVGARRYKVGVPGCGAGHQQHPVIPTATSQSWWGMCG